MVTSSDWGSSGEEGVGNSEPLPDSEESDSVKKKISQSSACVLVCHVMHSRKRIFFISTLGALDYAMKSEANRVKSLFHMRTINHSQSFYGIIIIMAIS